jgi:uncharacterized protein (TIGR02996 family)
VTNEERGLIESICDEPDDDGVRLVYADWLEENGQADRAELIRVQIAIENGVSDLRERESELITRLQVDWPGIRFRRGMGVVALYTAGRFETATRRQDRFSYPAWVIERRLKTGLGLDFARIVASPQFAQVTRLEIDPCNSLGSETTSHLASSRHATNLRSLSLKNGSVPGNAFGYLRDSAYLDNMRHLELVNCPVQEEIGTHEIRFPALDRLRSLVLDGSVKRKDVFQAFVRSLEDARLRSLSLAENHLSDSRLRILLRSPGIRSLEGLNLSANGIDDTRARALADCETLKGLKRLTLNHNNISDDGISALLDSPHLARLERLSLNWNTAITKQMRERLRERFRHPSSL